jgi:hypothetical protein
LDAASTKFPNRKAYSVAKIEVYYHKKWKGSIPPNRDKPYVFQLRRIYAGDYRSLSVLYQKSSPPMKITPTMELFSPKDGNSRTWVVTNLKGIIHHSHEPLTSLKLLISYSGDWDAGINLEASLHLKEPHHYRKRLIRCQTAAQYGGRNRLLLELLPQDKVPVGSTVTAISFGVSSPKPLSFQPTNLYILNMADSTALRRAVELKASRAGYRQIKWQENEVSIMLTAIAHKVNFSLYDRIVDGYAFADSACYWLPRPAEKQPSQGAYRVQKIDHTRYRVTGAFPPGGFFLTFAESFDHRWQLKFCRRPVGGGKGDCRALPEGDHFVADGYANSWWVGPGLGAEKAGDREGEGHFLISYKYQDIFEIIRIISWTGTVTIALALLWLFIRTDLAAWRKKAGRDKQQDNTAE